MLVIAVVVIINKVLDTYIFATRELRKRRTTDVIRFGEIVTNPLMHHKIIVSEVFKILWKYEFCYPGEVREAYIATSGRFNLYLAKPMIRVLPIEPAWDASQSEMSGPGTKVVHSTAMG